jgi:hypothetical protein
MKELKCLASGEHPLKGFIFFFMVRTCKILEINEIFVTLGERMFYQFARFTGIFFLPEISRNQQPK